MPERLQDSDILRTLLKDAPRTLRRNLYRFRQTSPITEQLYPPWIQAEAYESARQCFNDISGNVMEQLDAIHLFDLQTARERGRFRDTTSAMLARSLILTNRDEPIFPNSLTACKVQYVAEQTPNAIQYGDMHEGIVFHRDLPNAAAIDYAASHSVSAMRQGLARRRDIHEFDEALVSLIHKSRKLYRIGKRPSAITHLIPSVPPLSETQALLNLRSDIQRFRIPSD